MKKRHIFPLALTALLSLGACHDAPQSLTSSQPQAPASSPSKGSASPSSQGVPATDISLSAGTAKDSAHVTLHLPPFDSQSAAQAVMEQLNEALGGYYDGPIADADSLARYYLSHYLREMREARSDFDSDAPFERSLTVSPGYETPRLVTLDLQYYEYTGGAHGGTLSQGLSFRKSDGRQMGTNILSRLRSPEWDELAKKGLMEYFDVKTEEELQNCLLDVQLYALPLPQTEPSFQQNGLVFTYQQYEIAPYAAGMPSYVIPYDQLPPFLNATGRRLLAK